MGKEYNIKLDDIDWNHPITELPPREPFEGVHFSDDPIKDGMLHGMRRGSSGEGAESQRLYAGQGAAPGIHVYRAGSLAHPRMAKRKFVHAVKGDYALADIETNPLWADTVGDGSDPAAINAAEHALRNVGFDGYYRGSQPASVFLFGDHPVAREPQEPQK